MRCVLIPLALAQQERVQGVLVLKAARSGSSWFSSMVNRLADVRFYGEVIEWRTCEQYTLAQTEQYIEAMLTMSSVPKLHNATRTLAFLKEVGTTQADCAPGSPVRGAFVSPKGDCEAIRFSTIISRTCAKVVLFLRTNVVKMAVARVYDNKVARAPKVCDGRRRLGKASNLQTNCSHARKPLNVTVRLFMRILKDKAIAENERLVDVLRTFGTLRYLTVTYEGMQRDGPGQLEAFKNFVGLPWKGLHNEGLKSDDDYVKSTPDDLKYALTRDLWRGLDAAFDTYKSKADATIAACLNAMLRAVEPVDFLAQSSSCVPSFNDDGSKGGLREEVFHDMYSHILADPKDNVTGKLAKAFGGAARGAMRGRPLRWIPWWENSTPETRTLPSSSSSSSSTSSP